MKKIFIYALVLSTLNYSLVSCSKSNNEIVKTQENLSGEEIFRGIYFTQGKLPNLVEGLKPMQDIYNKAFNGKEKERENFNEFVDEIVAQINEIDPSYFQNFENQMKSSNFYTIELALNNGRKMVRAAGYRSEKLSGLFKLNEELQSKKVDLASEELANLDLTNSVDRDKFDSILLEKYGIDTKRSEYEVGCIAWVGVVAVAIVALGAVAYSVAAVYSSVEFWGKGDDSNTIGQRDVLISQISSVL